MTQVKITELMDLYAEKLKAAGHTYPARYNDYDLDARRDPSANHLLWMLTEAKAMFLAARGAKAFRWLGFVQHAMVDMKLFTLEEIKEHSKNADEYEFPPPEGMQTVQAKIALTLVCGHCGSPIIHMARQTWMPVCGGVGAIRFKNHDPDNRLATIQDVGIHLDPVIAMPVWDFNDLAFSYVLRPTVLSPYLNEESIALFVRLLKDAGWIYGDDGAKTWPERWAKHHMADAKAKPDPECPCHYSPLTSIMGHAAELMGMDIEEIDDDEDDVDFSPPKKPRKRKKKRKPDGGKKDAGGEEGTPDAGGSQE